MTTLRFPPGPGQVLAWIEPLHIPVYLKPGDPGYEEVRNDPWGYSPPPEVRDAWFRLQAQQTGARR